MKKILPFAILVVGILIVGGVFVGTRLFGANDKERIDEDANVPELPVERRPFTSLTPSQDGHFLNLVIRDINVAGAESLDYELLYQTGAGLTQGVPGTVKIAEGATVERELLLGSESSGVFRFDEGVETGSLTLRFRDANGKLVGKLSTDFHLQANIQTLSSADGSFVYIFDDPPSDTYFVVMQTFGSGPENIEGTNYAIFSSDGVEYSGSLL